MLSGVAILAATLVPSSDLEGGGWLWCWVCGKRGAADILLNVILFMPFGAALALGGVRWWRVWLYGALVSAGIEYCQLYIPGRDSSVADILSNSTGALLGSVVALALARTLRAGRPSPWQALAASGLGVAVIAATGWLLQPRFPASTYFGQWTPDLGHYEWYRGRVLEVSLDGVGLPSRRLADSPRVRQLLAAGAPLSVRALAGPRVSALAPVFSMADDRHRDILLLGFERDDLVFRYRPRAASWRLDRPALRLRGALRGVRPGDTLHVTVRRSGSGYSLSVNAVTSSTLGFTAGDGWALLMSPESLAPPLETLLGLAWVAALFFPAGYWGASRWGSVIGIAMAVAGLAVAAPAAGLLATPAREWGAAGFALVVGAGWRVAVLRRRRAQAAALPDASSRTSSPTQRSILA